MSTTRMRLGAVVTAGVLTLGLAACGDGDDPGTTPTATVEDGGDATEATGATDAADPTTAPAEDADTTTEPGTTEEPDASSAGETVPVEEFLAMLEEPGEEMLSRYTISMDVEAEGQQGGLDGAIDLSGDTPLMRMTLVAAEMGTIEIIYAEGEAYMAIPGLTPEGMFLLAPADMLGETADLEEVDVSAQTEVWEQGAQEVLYLGEEDVDGQTMRHYQVTVDAQAVMDASGGDDAAATSAGLEDEQIVYDVWLDDDNLMRKLAFEVEGQTLEMRMDDWGEPQDIQVPDPDQVMDIDELGTGSTG